MKRKRISRMLAVLLAFTMVFTMMPATALADTGTNPNVEWAGTSNNTHNNNVTKVQLPKTSNDINLLWQNQIGHDSWGSYYAGTTVVTGGYVYVTGQGKLWKINKNTGEATSTEGIGSSSGSDYDYMCTDGKNLYITTGKTLTAVNLDSLESVWSKSGNYGYYRPVQLLTVNNVDYLWCNGYVYKAETGELVTIWTDENNTTELSRKNFAWSSGALVDGLFYVTDYFNIYSIDFVQGRVIEQVTYSSTSSNASGGVAYDSTSKRLFWGSKAENKLFSIKIENGLLVRDSLKSAETRIKTVNTPVIYNGTVYLTGQANEDAIVQVFTIDANDSITLKYTVGKTAQAGEQSTSLVQTQSNPILSVGNGKVVYLYLTDYYGDLYVLEDSPSATSGQLVQLADTPNPSNVNYPFSYEQFAIDNDGNIYCYNESGYLFCYGKPKTADVKVTISCRGEFAKAKDESLVIEKDVTVNDIDKDGKLTVNDALIVTHDSFYDGSSNNGYESSIGDYGLAINKLWGDEGPGFGYWLNNKSCWSLEDTIKDGDYLTAFIYKDQTEWTDAYTKFEKNIYTVKANIDLALTLQKAGYDENWNTVFSPCSGASIKVIGSNNSIKPVYTTDANGQVTLKFEAAGTYKVMAYKDDGSIVPSAATITVTESDVPPADQENAKVTFTLKGDTLHSGTLHSGTYYPTWIFATTVDLTAEVKTVGDVFKQVLDANKYTYVGLEKGYISTITTPDGFSLSEFDNGKDSGWMYTVNGSHPNVGLNNYVLSDGDVVVWHYTDNYKEEPDYAGPSTPDVSTSGSSGSATTTTPTQVAVKGDTATATVKDENAKEIIKQAEANKSKEIVIDVKKDDVKEAEKVKVDISVTTAKDVLDKTEADLTVNTPAGSVTLTQDALKEAVAEAKGKTISVEVALVSKPTEIQQNAAGTNGHIIAVTITSDDKAITTFGGKTLTIKAEIPAKLNGKTVIAIHIADDGKIEKMTGKLVTENGKDFYEFETPHLSTFALADADEVKIDEPGQDKPSQDEADKAAEQKAKIKKVKTTVTLSTKGIKKGIKVTVKVPESKKADKTGIIIYRSTSRNAKPYAVYKKVSTKGSTYIIRNTKNVKGKNLTKGKTYYYKARAYKVINGKTYYGPMSAIKSIKAK